MPIIGRCDECAYEATFEELRKTIFDTVKTPNGEYPVYALEDKTVEFERNGNEMTAKIQLLFRCPGCEHQETWTI